MQNINERNRDVSNDVIRIIAMFMVIGIHWFGSIEDGCPQTIFSQFIINLIHKLTSLGVPLFFSLSGYYILGKEITDIRSFYYKRFIKIIIPYLLYAAFYVFYFTVFEDHEPKMLLKNYIVNVLTGNVHGTHWFVYCIVGLYFAAPFLSRMFRALSDKEVMILYFVSVGLGLINSFFGIFGSRFGVNTYVFEGSLLTFISGYCLQRCYNVFNPENKKSIDLFRFLIIGVLFVVYWFIKWDILLCVIAGLAVVRNNSSLNKNGFEVKIVMVVSKYTYSIYIVHAAVISAVLRVLSDWGGKYFWGKALLGYFAVFLISFTFTLVFDWLCTNRLIHKCMKN